MLGITVGPQTQPQPPYIRFEKRAQERRDAEGLPLYVDIDFAFITPHGSKDTVEKPAEEWLAKSKRDVVEGRLPQTWYDAYFGAYRAWKEGQEPPVNGTDIKNWPVLTPAQRKRMGELHINSVEILATANEELLGRIGMGAVILKQKAQLFLAAQQDTAPLVEKLAAQDVRLKEQDLQIQRLTEQMALMSRQQPTQFIAPSSVNSAADYIPPKDTSAEEAVDDIIDSELTT